MSVAVRKGSGRNSVLRSNTAAEQDVSEETTVGGLEAQLAESLGALEAALARAERAEADVQQRDARISEMEDQLDLYRAQRELLQSITDRVVAGILVLDGEEFRVKWANPAARSMIEEPYRTQMDIVGLRMDEFLPGANDTVLLEVLQQVVSTGQVQSDTETEYAGFERGVTYWGWSIVPLPGGSDTRPDLLLVVHELSEQVLSRRQIEAANERLRDSQARLAAELADMQQLQNASREATPGCRAK